MPAPSAAIVEPAHLAPSPDGGAASTLVGLIGPVDGLHVLLLGSGTVEVMCGLMRGGCAAVTAMRGTRCPRGTPADLVVIADVGAAHTACQALAHARRAAGPAAALFIQLRPGASRSLVLQVRKALLEQGYGAGRVQQRGGVTVITAGRGQAGASS